MRLPSKGVGSYSYLNVLQEGLDAVAALLGMLDSPVAALRAKGLVCFALLAQSHLPLLLLAFQAKLSPQVNLFEREFPEGGVGQPRTSWG